MSEAQANSGSGSRIACFGELLLRLSPPGRERLQQARELRVYVGGAEANVAVSLAQFGHSAAMVSVVPDNALGLLATRELRSHGVHTQTIRTGPGRMGVYFVECGAGHRPTRILYDREGSAFALAVGHEVRWKETLEGFDWLHLSGITVALGPEAAQAAITAVRAARSLGVRVSFDCNYRRSLWSRWDADVGALLRNILSSTELLFANERDLALILDPKAPTNGDSSEFEQFSSYALATLARFEHLRYIMTTVRNERGPDDAELSAVCMSRDGLFTTRPYALGTVVERIGGGDAFAAAVLHGTACGFDTQRTIDFGAAAACLKHSIAGDFSLATASEVDAAVRGEILMRR